MVYAVITRLTLLTHTITGLHNIYIILQLCDILFTKSKNHTKQRNYKK